MNTNTDDVIAYYRRACVCGMAGIQGSPAGTPQPSHPNEACPFNKITDLSYAWFAVQRTGTPRNEGGAGVSWYCTCQDGNEDQGSCEHVRLLISGQSISVIDSATDPRAAEQAGWRDIVIVLTTFGNGILRPIWAQDALRESEQRSRGAIGATGPTGATGVQGMTGYSFAVKPVPSGGQRMSIGPSGATGPSGPAPSAPVPPQPCDSDEDGDEEP